MKIKKEIISALKEFGTVDEEVPLSRHTTYKTGGPADLLIEPFSTTAVTEIAQIIRSEGLLLTVIGGGSNLLVGDKGIRGAVIRLCERDGRVGEISVGENESIFADARIKKKHFIQHALENGFGGVEFMAGIPGCIGGGIKMNAGTDMGNFAGILKEIEIVTREGDRHVAGITEEMHSYRKMGIGDGAIIIGGSFSLPRVDSPDQVKGHIREILNEREQKHPLDYPSAGSVFKNPPGYSSWRLIDEAGLKGERIGGAAVSELHTNFIINVDNASSRDIRDLIEFVQNRVLDRFGVQLETEIRMIGEF